MDLIEELRSENPNKERLLELITDENVSHIDNDGWTPLMFAFSYYGSKPNCKSNILSKILDMNCAPEHVNNSGETALMYAFVFYGANPNCNSHILSKLLDMNCNLEQVTKYGNRTALKFAFICYCKNPNYDPNIFLKLILLLHPSITRSKLIELLDRNAVDHNLKKNIMKVYLYNSRRTIINSRVSKRVLKGKYDSQSIFN
jgi:hypothetical protein